MNGFGDVAGAVDAITAVAAGATGAGGRVMLVDADLLSESGVQHLAKASVDALGHIDIIVNNAGEWRRMACPRTLCIHRDGVDSPHTHTLSCPWYIDTLAQATALLPMHLGT